MSEVKAIDLFAEDFGHAGLLRPLINRMVADQKKSADVRVRSARGGHGRVLQELSLYQKDVVGGALELPDLLVVAIDANCSSYNVAREAIVKCLLPAFADRTICACPDPHVERWYMADVQAFRSVVGMVPALGKQKCERGAYKNHLAQTVRDAGHVPQLGGLEFAQEIADSIDYYRAGKADTSLKHFLDDLTQGIKSL